MDRNLRVPLVTILIPCYNVERKVQRLFESILQQTYSNFELIVVNDGSTDNTESVIEEYEKLFKGRGCEFVYINQKNSGVAKACEVGLQYVRGEYLCWPDSDDFYRPCCVEMLLDFLQNNTSYNLVRCNADVFYEDNLHNSIGTLAGNGMRRFQEENLMRDYILENNVYFAPICYMMRFSAFKRINPQLFLCDSKAGQNYQMMLPLLYKGKCGYIDECLCCYMIYRNSHSHSSDYHLNYASRVRRVENKYECVRETLRHMHDTVGDLSEYETLAKQKLYAEKCLAAFDFGLKEDYCYFRPKVVCDYYINILRWPDKLRHIPLAFKIRYGIVRLKNIIKHQDKLFYYMQSAKTHLQKFKAS